MVGTARIVILLSCCAALFGGCHRERITPVPNPVTQPPGPAMPAEDVPPPESGKYVPPVPREDKAALLYQAKLDLLRVLICSEETIKLSGGTEDSDTLRQAASEHFTDMGFRIIDGSPCPDFDASDAELGWLANERDLDIYVLLRAQTRLYNKFGDFWSFEAEARGKVAQISDKELLTTRTVTARGERDLRENVAAESSLVKCGREMASKLTDEILRKSARGTLLRRLRVDGLRNARYVDYVRTGLEGKPGVQSVVLRSWDEKTGTALFWVRIDAGAKENLAAYLEQLADIRLRVERLDNTGVQTRRRGLLE
jgi:hypothetical protein